jgi:hypothetical protein
VARRNDGAAGRAGPDHGKEVELPGAEGFTEQLYRVRLERRWVT